MRRLDVQGGCAHRSTPGEGSAASASGPNVARNMAKFAPVAAVGEMRYATDTFVLRKGVPQTQHVTWFLTRGGDAVMQRATRRKEHAGHRAPAWWMSKHTRLAATRAIRA